MSSSEGMNWVKVSGGGVQVRSQTGMCLVIKNLEGFVVEVIRLVVFLRKSTDPKVINENPSLQTLS